MANDNENKNKPLKGPAADPKDTHQQGSRDRQGRIIRTSLLGVVLNLIFAAIKIVIGMAAGSLAIISEGTNNAADAASSLLTLVGTRLSAKHADAAHPFGYGRIEYLTGLVISGLVLYTGIELLKESVGGILHPESVSVSLIMIAIIAMTAVVKFILGLYTIRAGQETGSAALEAVGREGRNDAVFSVVTIAVSLIYLFAGLSLDAYAGLIFAIVILRSGLGTLKETLGDLLGRPGQEELARALYKEIRRTEGIVGAADMMLHNYGPEAWSGSVNIEIDHKVTIGEAYARIHALQLRIMHEYHVTMVFGIYAVDNDHEMIRELRRSIVAFVRAGEHVTGYHALYIEPDSGRIYCDLVVDYELEDWEALREEFTAYMAEYWPGREIELTIETEFV